MCKLDVFVIFRKPPERVNDIGMPFALKQNGDEII